MIDDVYKNPDALYYAVCLSSDMRYRIGTKVLYRILDAEDGELDDDAFFRYRTMFEMLGAEFAVFYGQDGTMPDIKEKIKRLLKMLGPEHSPETLNAIIKGQISPADVLKEPQLTAWNLMWKRGEDGHLYVRAAVVNALTIAAEQYAVNECERQVEAAREKATRLKMILDQQTTDREAYITESMYRHEVLEQRYRDEAEKLPDLEEELKRIRLTAAKLAGYDRDYDFDGIRGVNPETGYVTDYDDIDIADGRDIGD